MTTATTNSKGITIQVLRGLFESTMDGISSRYDDLTVIGVGLRGAPAFDELPETCQIDEAGDAPVALEIFTTARGVYLAVVPVEEAQDGLWRRRSPEGYIGPMYGGNEAVALHPAWKQFLHDLGAELGTVVVRVHDRYETAAHYNAMV